MKKVNLIIICVFISFNAFSQVDENVFREENSENTKAGVKKGQLMDMHLNFNADWHFYLGEIPGFYVPEFDDTDWRVLDVPHDWSVEGQFSKDNPSASSGAYLPTGIGC